MKLIKIVPLILFLLEALNSTQVFSKNRHSQKNDSLRIIYYQKRAKLLFQDENYKRAIEYSYKLLKEAKKIDSLSLIAGTYYRLGFYYKKDNNIDSTYKYYSLSKETYLKINDSVKAARNLINLSKIESNYGDYLKSDSSAISALRILNDKSFSMKASIYNTLGINANEQGEFLEAIKWYDYAIKEARNEVKKIRYQNNKANNFICLSDYKKSIRIYKSIVADEYFDSIPKRLKAKILDTYAYARFLNNEKVAVEEFLKPQKLKNEIKDYYGLTTNYRYLSSYYKKKSKSKSLKYAYKMYNLSKQIGNLKDRISAIDKIIELEIPHKVRGLAIERIFLSDSVRLANQQSRNKFAKIIYNYEEEKEKRLKAETNLAQEKSKRLEQELVLEQQKTQKQLWLFLGGTSFLGFITYFFYKRNRTKREKVIEVYKTETRLAKKIHDVLANDMYLAMNKIQKENGEDASILYDLEKIYTQTRNISHENSPVVTGRKFENFLKQLFVDFSGDDCRVLNMGLSEVKVNSLRKEKQIVLYRILQELLVNMKKHSNATLVVVSFSKQKDKLYIQYKDNGDGVSKIDIKNGLQNMETRIKSIGGTIIFDSEVRKGFQAKFQFKK